MFISLFKYVTKPIYEENYSNNSILAQCTELNKVIPQQNTENKHKEKFFSHYNFANLGSFAKFSVHV